MSIKKIKLRPLKEMPKPEKCGFPEWHLQFPVSLFF